MSNNGFLDSVARALYLLFSQEAKVPCVIESAIKGVLMIFEAIIGRVRRGRERRTGYEY